MTEGEAASDNVNKEEEEEEFWPTPSLLTGHTVHTIRFGDKDGKESTILRYKSMPTEELTPLDMIYASSQTTSNANNNNDSKTEDPFRDDEFYDGTGNLMWMAAISFGHLLAQKVEPLRSYLYHGSPSPLPPTTLPKEEGSQRRRRRVCELGCGTGGAGINLLLSEPSATSCHVVFTDNDAQSLELCASNCQLNDLSPESYSQELLGWGYEHFENLQQQQQQGGVLEPHSFDVILATDVIYDLKMIAPLFETVDALLRNKTNDAPGGHLVLSHVPRFCIPQDDKDETSKNNDPNEDSPSQAFLELEDFIRAQASKVGLVLVATLRPHQVLSEEGLGLDQGCSNEEDSMQQLTLEHMKEAHAVVFVFERS